MNFHPFEVLCGRRKVIKLLNNEVRMGNMDYFFNNILPPIRPEFDIEQIFKYCIKKKILTKGPKSKGYTWKAVPKNAKVLTNRVYIDPFMRIFRAVIKAAQETSPPKTTRIPFMPIDGREARLSDNPEFLSEENLSSYVYVENPMVNFPGSIEERHWLSAGFGFHFKGEKGDEADVSTFLFSFQAIYFILFYFISSSYRTWKGYIGDSFIP